MERTLKIKNKLGLHARPAALLVETASRYDADVQVIKHGSSINAKSIMGVLMLAAEQGSWLRLTASGADALDALDALADLVGRGFSEV
jgi:phosphocarrier protein